MLRSLSEFRIRGVKTNIPFLENVIHHEKFRTGQATTTLIDTSPEFYPEIVTTHTFTDRLNTIAAVQESGMSVCCGGIIGLGESITDRLRMLEVLSSFDPPPESVPINCLMAMPGTPLGDQPPVDIFELVRLLAVTRIALPQARVRLAAGRTRISREGQALCFFAGANSIFYGDKLLTAENPAPSSCGATSTSASRRPTHRRYCSRR